MNLGLIVTILIFTVTVGEIVYECQKLSIPRSWKQMGYQMGISPKQEKVLPKLISMYQKLELIRDIFDSPRTGNEALWKIVKLTELSYKDFPKSCQTIKIQIDQILPDFDNRITQGIAGQTHLICLFLYRAFKIS